MSPIASFLKTALENYWNHTKTNNPFYQTLFSGKIRHETVARYLESVRHMVVYTPIHLTMAAQEAHKRGMPKLADFYKLKLSEETGHDEWAVADLEKLAILAPKTRAARQVSPGIEAMIRYNEETIKKDPMLYMVHVFFAEYFTVLEGPDFTAALRRIGIQQASIIDNHVELDVDHVEELVEMITDQIPDSYLPAFEKHLKQTLSIFEGFCAELESYNAAA